MAVILQHKAAQSVNQPSSTFYSGDKNPVINAFGEEYKLFLQFMKKKASAAYKKKDDEAFSRGADTLFALWNSYEGRLPTTYYQQKVIQMGDFLVTIKEYNLAVWQCYGRYLDQFGDQHIEDIVDISTVKEIFFPDGLETDNASLTFRALYGKSICNYQLVLLTDPKLQNTQSVSMCLKILAFLRLITQVVLPREPLCWLVYNGTIHIYSVSRHLMTLGHSAKVLEFLLWACMCMEHSVPLLSVRYLSWRTTLYTAVCQCYYDCKASQHAESFARRALSKVNELSQLEKISSAPPSGQIEIIFRQSAVRLGIMVYKRAVFDTRKKPKGLLRPKTRSNLKDAQSPTESRTVTIVASDGRLIWHKTSKQRLDDLVKKQGSLPWPRTAVEKLLADMFEGSAAQFLAILETLADSTRRTLLSSPAAPDTEDHILDTYSELFFAGMEIIAGGAGHSPRGPHSASDVSLAGVTQDKCLIDLAARSEDGIPVNAVVKFVKWAYNYEQWELYESLVITVLDYLKSQNDQRYTPEIKSLEILQAMDPLNPSRKSKKPYSHTDDSSIADGPAHSQTRSQTPVPRSTLPLNDEMVQLAEVLYSCAKDPMAESVDRDMVVDATLFLWNRCKSVFQKVQTGASDSGKYLQKIDQPNKWVHILSVVHEVMYWCGISTMDSGVTAEVAIRLALVLENNAANESDTGKVKAKPAVVETGSGGRQSREVDDQSVSTLQKDATPVPKSPAARPSGEAGRDTTTALGRASTSFYTSSILQLGAQEQLLSAREILERALQGMSKARQIVALTDGKSIADVSWVKDNATLKPTKSTDILDAADKDTTTEKADDNPKGVHNTIMDLHLELLYMYHRVCIKLAKTVNGGSAGTKAKTGSGKGQRSRAATEQRLVQRADGHVVHIETVDELLSSCGKNLVSKALFLMQKTLLMSKSGAPTPEQAGLLQDAVSQVTKAQDQEYKLFTHNAPQKQQQGQTASVRESGVPPAPLLLCRTDTTMVFRPGPYNPPQKVAWYRLFGRLASGSNVKVRLNDYFLPGTGEEVPAYDCELHVSGLQTNEKYVFAVAAYTASGVLIGESIGDTTKPILASHPLPILMTWAFLSQAAYQVGCYPIGLTASTVLWEHFVAPVPPPESDVEVVTAREDFKLTLRKLNPKTCSVASPVLLRMFLTSIFINVDVSMREGEIYCDKLCDRGPYSKGQLQRLAECERMLVAMELAGWLNESNLALQAVVQCYGLLAPIIHYKIPSTPVIQVLTRCYAILLEMPASLRQRRQQSVSDSLHHMIAVITYHMAKVLRVWKQRGLANHVTDTGKKMLAIEKESEQKGKAEAMDFIEDVDGGAGQAGAVAAKKKRPRRFGQTIYNVEGPKNEELRALEAHMLKLSKLAHNADELTGSEDPNILHAFIAALPSRYAYKEVVKFRRRARFLEFVVQVVQKALSEGLVDTAIEWCEDSTQWLIRRNEQLSAVKATLSKQPGGVTVVGDDPKKYAAAVIEYTKNKPTTLQVPTTKNQQEAQDTKSPRRKKKKFQLLVHLRSHQVKMSDAAKAQQEHKELQAFEKLEQILPEFYHTQKKKQRLRKICADEIPWRTQLNILQGLCHFAQFLNKVVKRDKLMGPAAGDIYRSSYLDNEWFTFETAGTLVVGWDGGPSRAATRQDDTRPSMNDPVIAQLQQMDPGDEYKMQPSAIEVAALVTVGKPVPVVPPPPDDKESDTMRTYRSYDSEKPTTKAPQHHIDYAGITTQATVDSLKKTFDHLKKAVVLAHRGSHWTLLQNASRALWNCAHTALLHTFASGHTNGLLSVEALRAVVWRPFYTAVDCLLDMMVFLQNQAEASQKKSKKQPPVLVNSWVGSVSDEKGGASLKFENPLDDLSTADSRWMRRMVLRVLEMLYYEQQWECLADVAMRFNVLAQERYSEQVSPLLIQAQRKLISRLQAYGGPPPVQPHFQLASDKLGGVPITARNYTDVQLTVELDPSNLKAIDMGGRIDPEGHDVYGGASDAGKLVCVPLDVGDSLSVFQQALSASNYTARALQHSRKLLVLYLATQQNAAPAPSHHSIHSRVGFSETDDQPQMTVPPDLARAEFKTMAEVQTSALPKSQLGVVLTSYDKTIEMLLARKQLGLTAQAMHELGNLHYHAANIRAAFKWWSESLDLIMNTTDTLHSWRQLLTGQKSQHEISSQLLDRCGMWGCLLGAVLASKIAQYILTSDLGLRMESCFLSAFLFKALFRASLPHPTADRDYALYEIGEGCEVQYLVPGVDLLSDRYRCDGRTLLASLRWVAEELSRGRHNLMVLPLLTLYQYLTTFVCRDLQRAVDGRILKVRILTELSLYSEAFIVLGRLLHGERLPQTADNNFRQVESKMSSQKFNSAKPLMEPTNLKMLETLIEKRLSPSLATLYGPHLTCHLSLAQAHLMVAIASTIQAMPDVDIITTSSSPEPPQRKPSPTTSTTISKPPNSVVSKKTEKTHTKITVEDALASEDGSAESLTVTEDTGKKFTGGKKPLTLEAIKGVLLRTAEQTLKIMVEIMQGQGTCGQSAAELELIVLAKLELAAVNRELHLATTAAQVVVSAMTALQESSLFGETKKPKPPRRLSSFKGSKQKFQMASQPMPPTPMEVDSPSQYQYQNFQSRSRLDARLWLDCRLALVKCLMGQVRGMGLLATSDGPSEGLDCRQFCMQGLTEAEACGDNEMQAEFLMQGALLDLQEGRSLDDIKQTLQEVVSLLEQQQTLSSPGHLLLALAKIQLTDLRALAAHAYHKEKGTPITDSTLAAYTEAQQILLNQMMLLGEKIERHISVSYLSAPASPLLNVYLPHLLYLAKTKMRIGHALARRATREQVKNSAKVLGDHTPDPWLHAAGVLSTGLELGRVCARQEGSLLAELLLHLGKVQRQLARCRSSGGDGGAYQPRAAVGTLLEAVNVSMASNQDLGLIRQAYLEVALLYLDGASQRLKVINDLQQAEREEAKTLPIQASPEKKKKSRTPSSSASKKPSRSGPPTKATPSKRDLAIKEAIAERTKELTAAWLAVQSATAVAIAQRSLALLVGDPSLTSLTLKGKVRDVIPDFVMQDLSFTKAERGVSPPAAANKPTLKTLDEVQADMEDDDTISAGSPSPVPLLAASDKKPVTLSWIHLLSYTAILQRSCNLDSIGVGTDGSNRGGSPANENGSLGAGFDLGFVNHTGFDTGINHDVVRLPLLCGDALLRLQSMLGFLRSHLSVFATGCQAVRPPTGLSLPFPGPPTDLQIPAKSYPENAFCLIGKTGEDSNKHAAKTSDKALISGENELCLQWYQPSTQDPNGTPSRQVLLLYAIGNSPPPKSAPSKGPAETPPPVVGSMTLALPQVTDLHDRLAVLRQKAEISLAAAEKPKPPSTPAMSTPSKDGSSTPGKPANRKSKRTARIAQLSAKVKRDENLEALLRQCVDTIQELLKYKAPEQDQQDPQAIPFEVELPRIHSLEQLFDPSYGDCLKGTKIYDWLAPMLQ
ncbi:cilia- and flagella-associated protein 54-like [Patiria miniata]|uniref:Cilia- and flagella-associated protein 54 n=1 Tax=Patiria miniata TaxID=46514 RepID=A0A914B1P4_PATMI|nr:cilia- and flagella-associated protein 54-like [Patiria miniata]